MKNEFTIYVMVMCVVASILSLAGYFMYRVSRTTTDHETEPVCNWGCPSTLADRTAEYERRIDALEAQNEALRNAPPDGCQGFIADSVARNVTVPMVGDATEEGPSLLDQERFVARKSCAYWYASRRAHPDDPRWAEWTMHCRFAHIEDPYEAPALDEAVP